MKAIAEMLGGVAFGGVPLRLILIGLAAVAALGLWLYVGHLQDENNRLRGDLAVALDAAEQNVKALAAANRHTVSVINALTAERDAFAARVKQLTKIRSEVNHAPQSDDGPVAPVLARVLDSLRNAKAGAGGEGGKAPGAGQPVDLSVDALAAGG